jgi:hypothetical protein
MAGRYCAKLKKALLSVKAEFQEVKSLAQSQTSEKESAE